MAQINAGEVSVTLNGEELVLKPTLRAMTMISRQFSGLAEARRQLVSENIDAVVYILRTGAGLSDKEARGLDEKVFQNGITADLLVPLIRYVAIVGNGGKPLPDDPASASDDEAASRGN